MDGKAVEVGNGGGMTADEVIAAMDRYSLTVSRGARYWTACNGSWHFPISAKGKTIGEAVAACVKRCDELNTAIANVGGMMLSA